MLLVTHLIGSSYIAGQFRIAMLIVGINAQSKENCEKFYENHANRKVPNAPSKEFNFN